MPGLRHEFAAGAAKPAELVLVGGRHVGTLNGRGRCVGLLESAHTFAQGLGWSGRVGGRTHLRRGNPARRLGRWTHTSAQGDPTRRLG